MKSKNTFFSLSKIYGIVITSLFVLIFVPKLILSIVEDGIEGIKEMAEDHFVKLAPESEIGNEIDFVLMETERLRKLYPTVCIVPLLYKVENNRLYPVNENQR